MSYHIARNGQTYGPYTLDELRRYVASGNVLGTDLVKSDEVADWLPALQVLASGAGPYADPQGPVNFTAMPDYPRLAGSAYPPPPKMHWALVLLISFLCGVFVYAWMLVQAGWLRKVEPDSKAMLFYLYGILVLVLGLGLTVSSRTETLGALLFLSALVLIYVGHFSMRASLLRHFNGPEPIGLELNPVMTFFFSTFYFQYHFTRIHAMQQAALYYAPRPSA